MERTPILIAKCSWEAQEGRRGKGITAIDNVDDPVHESLVRVARRTLVVVAIVALALLVWRIRVALLLGFIGIPLALVLGVISGMLEFIPIFGPVHRCLASLQPKMANLDLQILTRKS